MMRRKLVFTAGLLFVLVIMAAIPIQAASIKASELFADQEFVKATPDQRLGIINKKLEEKQMKSSDISSDVVSRLFWDAVVSEKDAAARLDRYAKLRADFTKLPSTFDLETSLTLNFLATNPEAMKADLVEKMKFIQKFQDEKKITWPAVAPLHSGMLAYHLAIDPEFNKMTPDKKLNYLERLVADKVCGKLTTTKFAKGIASEAIAGAPQDKQQSTAQDLSRITDFFTQSAIKRGYLE